MLEAMPVGEDYRAMSGKSKVGSSRPDGKPPARRSIFSPNTFAIYRRKNAQSGMRPVACCVPKVAICFRPTVGAGLKGRFGENFAKVNMYPVPILTRDIPGYRIFSIPTVFGKG